MGEVLLERYTELDGRGPGWRFMRNAGSRCGGARHVGPGALSVRRVRAPSGGLPDRRAGVTVLPGGEALGEARDERGVQARALDETRVDRFDGSGAPRGLDLRCSREPIEEKFLLTVCRENGCCAVPPASKEGLPSAGIATAMTSVERRVADEIELAGSARSARSHHQGFRFTTPTTRPPPAGLAPPWSASPANLVSSASGARATRAGPEARGGGRCRGVGSAERGLHA